MGNRQPTSANEWSHSRPGAAIARVDDDSNDITDHKRSDPWGEKPMIGGARPLKEMTRALGREAIARTGKEADAEWCDFS